VLSAGAFSDEQVIEATKDVVCIYVDLEWGRKHIDLGERYRVRGFPTVVYADSEGEEIGRMQSFDASAIAADVAQLARDHTRRF
jgi:thioredoxin-related protein